MHVRDLALPIVLVRLVTMVVLGVSVDIRMLVVHVRVGHVSDRTGWRDRAAMQPSVAGNA
jgi:hypothetical protein